MTSSCRFSVLTGQGWEVEDQGHRLLQGKLDSCLVRCLSPVGKDRRCWGQAVALASTGIAICTHVGMCPWGRAAPCGAEWGRSTAVRRVGSACGNALAWFDCLVQVLPQKALACSSVLGVFRGGGVPLAFPVDAIHRQSISIWRCSPAYSHICPHVWGRPSKVVDIPIEASEPACWSVEDDNARSHTSHRPRASSCALSSLVHREVCCPCCCQAVARSVRTLDPG